MNSQSGIKAQPQAKRPRDPRLDFFRGLAMFIILLAHTPGNTWTLWIPARFGFSDATEIFVFCSGMASAMAFGAIFANRGFLLGSARIGFRVWQVYWAHIGIFLFTAIMLWSIDHFGVGARENPYINGPYVRPLFEQTGEALLGLMTLTWITGLFDILPMYLVILGMIPLVMLAHRLGGVWGAVALVVGMWLAANLAGYARKFDEVVDPPIWQAALIAAGRPFMWMNLPGSPWGDGTWFFNPFGWQLVFFAGFGFGMGWLPAPPVRLWLVPLASAVVLLNIPVAWYKIHSDWGLIAHLEIHASVQAVRDFLEPMRWKTWQGLGRFTHFLALAYLAWAAVGPGGVRLTEGWRPLHPGWRAGLVAAAIVLVTLPFAAPHEVGLVISGYGAWVEEMLTPNQLGMTQLLHLVALIVLLWWAIGPEARAWVSRDAVLAAVPVIRKVGTQSLAVFTVSIPLSRFNGWVLDVIGRDVWTRAGINLIGFVILIGVAYFVGWIKKQPWRGPASTSATPTESKSERRSDMQHPTSLRASRTPS